MINKLTNEISKDNLRAFIWHGIFLSLASNFMDIHTIIPSILIKAGGNAILLGFLTAIMVGGSSLMQIVFAGFLSHKPQKKKFLITAISLRVFVIFVFSFILFYSHLMNDFVIIFSIFVLISTFSFSGSFANIAYTDIIGKSIIESKRKYFFSIKQVFGSIGILISAFAVRVILKNFEYPQNYGLLLLFAGLLLFIASFGFWKIKEVTTTLQKKRSFIDFIKLIPSEVAQNSNLKNYLFIINFIGLGFSFIPFMILFAKKNFELSYGLIGNILIFKVTGMLLASLILYKRSKKFEYKKLLYVSFVIGAILPILCLVLKDNYLMYQLIFILTGIFITIFNIAKNGILIEISNNENRSLYTGISGVGNILPTIFPLIVGVLIATLGYKTTFISVSIIVVSSFIFIKKLKCK